MQHFLYTCAFHFILARATCIDACYL